MAVPLMILANPRNWRAQPVYAYNQGGYQPGGTHKTLSAAIALGTAALVVAGLATALVAPDILVRPLKPFEVINVIPPPSPPPPPPKVLPDDPPPPTTITLPTPRIDTPPTSANRVDIIDRPIVDTGPFIIPSSGGGTAITADPPPPPAPVLRGPSRNERFARAFQPPYPSARQREGIEGRCRVRVTINLEGRVTAVENTGCPDEQFFEATQRQALRYWCFHPATRDGVPVEGTIEQTVVFRIDQ